MQNSAFLHQLILRFIRTYPTRFKTGLCFLTCVYRFALPEMRETLVLVQSGFMCFILQKNHSDDTSPHLEMDK